MENLMRSQKISMRSHENFIKILLRNPEIIPRFEQEHILIKLSREFQKYQILS